MLISLNLIYIKFENSCSVQSLSRVQLFVAPWTAACQASLSIASYQSLLKLISIESVMKSLLKYMKMFPEGVHEISLFEAVIIII